MSILKTRGGQALSAFRLDKLNARVRALSPGLAVASARFWHLVETDGDLSDAERATLDRLLTYGPPAPDPDEARQVVLVVPRLGTISPWSSKDRKSTRLNSSP